MNAGGLVRYRVPDPPQPRVVVVQELPRIVQLTPRQTENPSRVIYEDPPQRQEPDFDIWRGISDYARDFSNRTIAYGRPPQPARSNPARTTARRRRNGRYY